MIKKEAEYKYGTEITWHKDWQDGINYSCYIDHKWIGKLNFLGKSGRGRRFFGGVFFLCFFLLFFLGNLNIGSNMKLK